MTHRDAIGTEFQRFFELSNEIQGAISELRGKTENWRELKRLNDELAQIADQMEAMLSQSTSSV